MQKNINPVNADNYWLRGIYIFGGDEEDRTLDLTDANRTLSQLSYAPKNRYVSIIASFFKKATPFSNFFLKNVGLQYMCYN